MTMKARCIEFSETHAVVAMIPSWLALLFGARATFLELGRVKKPGDSPGRWRFTPWCCPGSGRMLDDLEHRDLILDALDFREADDLRAKTREAVQR